MASDREREANDCLMLAFSPLPSFFETVLNMAPLVRLFFSQLPSANHETARKFPRSRLSARPNVSPRYEPQFLEIERPLVQQTLRTRRFFSLLTEISLDKRKVEYLRNEGGGSPRLFYNRVRSLRKFVGARLQKAKDASWSEYLEH